jgi:pSer/pThr/pTyr-binding forkhead associated (FHA) protein
MKTATPKSPIVAQEPTEVYEAPAVLAHGVRRDSLAFHRPAPGRYLAIEEGPLTRLVELRKAVTHLGRGFSADLRIEDQSVSRRHAVLVDRSGGVRILDDRSANGTFVNGRRVTEATLRDRDVIRLGRVVLVYVEIDG